MRSSNRISGIDIIGSVPWGTHFCQFYQTKEDFIDIIIPYFKAGLENNEFCLWVIPEQLDPEEAKEALRVGIPDIGAYLQNGQIEVIPYTYWHVEEDDFDPQTVLNHLIEKTSKAFASGYDGLRYSGNDFFDHEKLLDSIIGKYPIMALCAYSVDKYSALDIIEIATNHQFAVGKKKGKLEKIEISSQKNNKECNQVEAALSMSKEGFCALVTASSEMVYRVSPDWSEMRYFYGRDFLANTESPNSTWLNEYILPEDQLRVTAIINESIRTKSTYQTEHRVRLADGSVGWIFSRAVPLLDANGEIVEWFGAASDITKRKQAEEALQQSRDTLQAIFDTAPAAIVVAQADGKILLTNANTQLILGGSITGDAHGPEGGYKVTMLDGSPVKTGQLPLSLALKGQTVTGTELLITRSDGTKVVILASATPLQKDHSKPWGAITVFQDITKRKEAEAKLQDTLDNLDKLVKERTEELQRAYDSLKQSERNLAEAQEMAHVGSWERDFATNELHWSDETYRIFGLKPQESKVNYYTFLSYVHPDDRDRLDNAIKEALKEKPFDIDYRIITANREERIAHEKAEVIFDEKNDPVRIIGTIQDITEHRKAEEEIQNLANIVESSTEAIITESFEGIIKSWNKGAEQVYGYSAEEALGKSISILEPPTLTGETQRLFKMVQQGRKFRQYETLRLRKDGKIINVSLTIFPVFDNQGKTTAASIIATDITRRKAAEERLKESEEKYRNIVETSNEGIYLVDDEARITYANKIMETSGYTLEEIVGRPIWDFISEESKPIAKRSFEKRRQGIDDSYELKLMRKDGSFIWGLISAKSLFNKEGKFIGYLGMLTDITERKKAEEILANLETARKKEIHHRIKNNLQVISSLLDLQAEQFRNRECVENSEVLEAFRESQDRVISMALIHEELYRGEELDKLNFSPYIEELAKTLFQTYRLGNTDISLSIDLEESLLFDMDVAVPLGIIVNELVSNSLKHAFPDRKKGEIQIKLHREKTTELETENCQSASTSFILTISDNGIGIPENLNIEDLDSLGMQLVASLVDQLDGKLELRRDNGTEFTIRFG